MSQNSLELDENADRVPSGEDENKVDQKLSANKEEGIIASDSSRTMIKTEEEEHSSEEAENWQLNAPPPYLRGVTEETIPECEFDDLDKVAEAKILKAKLGMIRKIREWFGLPELKDLPPLNKLEQHIIHSMEKLLVLLQDCNQAINNVRVASMKSESERLRVEQEKRNQLLYTLDREQRIATKKYNKINSNWRDIRYLNDPLDIHNETNKQRDKCVALLERKDAVIEKLKGVVEGCDDIFLRELIKQENEIYVLIDRIEKLLLIIGEAYRVELDLIEKVTNQEQKKCLLNSRRRWAAFIKQKTRLEKFVMQERFRIIEEHEIKFDKLIIESQESIRKTKIEYLSQIRELTLKVDEMRGICDLNSQKLKYNYTLLLEREDENRVSKTNLQNKIGELQVQLDAVKAKALKDNKDLDRKINRLKDELKYYTTDIFNLDKKADLVGQACCKKYFQLWDFNQKIADDLISKILEMERIFYEQELCITWPAPQTTKFSKEDMPSFVKAKKILAELNKEDTLKKRRIDIFLKAAKDKIPAEDSERRARIFKVIFQVLADKSGFLREELLEKFMEGIPVTDKTLIKLDQLMVSLGITSEEDMLFFSRYLLPYSYCKTCDFTFTRESIPIIEYEGKYADDLSDVASLQDEKAALSELVRVSAAPFETSSNVIYKEFCDSEKETSSPAVGEGEPVKAIGPEISKMDINQFKFDNDLAISPQDLENKQKLFGLDKLVKRDIRSEYNDKQELCKALYVPPPHTGPSDVDGTDKCLLSCNYHSHTPTISSVYVVRAIRDFVVDYHGINKQVKETCSESIVSKKRVTLSRLIDDSEVKDFWDKYKNVITDEQLEQWDVFQMAMKCYIDDLRRRHNLNENIRKVKKTNVELRRLLQRYLEPRRNISVFESIVEKVDQALNSSTESDELTAYTSRLDE